MIIGLGCFKSKRGVFWNYAVHDDGYIEQWHENTVRCNGGWKSGKETFLKKPTEECKKIVEEKYKLNIDK